MYIKVPQYTYKHLNKDLYPIGITLSSLTNAVLKTHVPLLIQFLPVSLVTVKSHFTDPCLIWTPLYYRQFALPLGN